MVTELRASSAAARRRADLAELRDVPVGVRAGRADRRRPGAPAVAAAAAVLLALVAAGDAVPVEHEVPARVGAALRVLRRAPATCPGSASPSAIAEGFLAAPAAPAQRRTPSTRRPAGRGPPPLPAPAADADAGRGRARRAVRAAPARAGAGADGQARRGCATRASTRTRSGYARTDRCAQVRARPPTCAPDTAPATVSVAGRVCCVRDYGGVCFAQLRDWSGDAPGAARPPTGSEPRRAAALTGDVDLGDLIEVTGRSVTIRPRRAVGARRRLAADRASACARCPTSGRG